MLVGYRRVPSDNDRQRTDLQRDALLDMGVAPWQLFLEALTTYRCCSHLEATEGRACASCGPPQPLGCYRRAPALAPHPESVLHFIDKVTPAAGSSW